MGHARLTMDDMLAEYGLSTTTVALAVVVIVVIGAAVSMMGEGGSEVRPTVLLHPEHLKFLKKIEAEHCDANTEGKGIRCIIDYLRENEDQVKVVCAEKAAYTDGFEEFSLDLYFQQIEWLETQGIKVGAAEDTKYEGLSKAFRAMLDYTIRNQKNEAEINEIFADIRCLNCQENSGVCRCQ